MERELPEEPAKNPTVDAQIDCGFIGVNPFFSTVFSQYQWIYVSLLFGFKQSEELGARHEQFATQRPARFEFAALDEAVNAEIIYPQHIGCLLHRVG